MARDIESLKIMPWAESGDRTDPDATTLSPSLSRTVGWPASFSEDDGDTPRREVFNQIFCEITSMLNEINQRGVLEWDASISYQKPAFVSSGGLIHTSNNVNSLGVDPQEVGQTSWVVLAGTNNVPGKVDGITTTNTYNSVGLGWGFPLDGGSAITKFEIQWSTATLFSSVRQFDVTDNQFIHAGLVSGTAYRYQIRAVNSVGNGDWSDVEIATPVDQSPDKPTVLCIREGDLAGYLTWVNGTVRGSAITGLEIRYRSGTQAYSTTTRGIVLNASNTALGKYKNSGLTNGVAYTFRIRNLSAVGASDWSDEVVVTPIVGSISFTVSDPIWVYPWATDSASVVMVGSGGGGNSNSNQSGLNGSNTVFLTVVAGAGAGATSGAGSGGVVSGFAGTNDMRSNGELGGDRGVFGVGGGGTSGGNGNDGGSGGSVKYNNVFTKGNIYPVVVGVGGAGQGSGESGQDGIVIVTPIY